MLYICLPGITVFEKGKKRPGDKRQREKNFDPEDVDGYLGPWGKYVDEKSVMKPSEVGRWDSFVQQ